MHYEEKAFFIWRIKTSVRYVIPHGLTFWRVRKKAKCVKFETWKYWICFEPNLKRDFVSGVNMKVFLDLYFYCFQCTTRVCHDSAQANRDSMELYKIHHEPGTSFKCYFHPKSVVKDGAVLKQTIHWSLAIHVTLWPGLGIITGIGICTCTFYWKRCRRNRYDLEESARAQFDDNRITDPYNNLERY